MKIKFWKLSGAGNDFIAFDNRTGVISQEKKSPLAKKLCQRGHSIGADGLLFIEPSQQACFFMSIINADGSIAEACGNASRCIALLAYELNLAPREITFETIAGIYRAQVKQNTVAVSMPQPYNIQMDMELHEEWMPAPYIHSINIGVPHVVLFVEDVDKTDVLGIGRKLRHHHRFQPEGANVNFVQLMDANNLRIRTYERGVERETLACGTGCIAAAVVGGLAGFSKPPTRLHTTGGMINTIHYSMDAPYPTNIVLEGEARIVFRGEIDLDI